MISIKEYFLIVAPLTVSEKSDEPMATLSKLMTAAFNYAQVKNP